LLPLTLPVAAGISGCSPTWGIGGAYFPAWLVCMVAGLVLALAARYLLIVSGIDRWVRPRVLAYPAIAVAFTLLVYLIFFL
jgi:hypothetical protein